MGVKRIEKVLQEKREERKDKAEKKNIHNMKRTLFLIICLVATMFAQARRITDEAIKNFCREASMAIAAVATDEAKQAKFDAEAAKWAKDNSLSQITDQQVEILFGAGGTTLDKYMRLWLEPTLSKRAENDAAFAFLYWKYMPENDGFMHGEKETAALLRFLKADNLQEMLSQHADYSQEVLSALATMKDANWHTEGFPEAITRFVKCSLPDAAVMECVKAFNSVARVDSLSGDYRETIRKACVDQYETLEKKLDNARKQKACRENIKYLNGPFACGTLVGSEAPALHFLQAFKQEGDEVRNQEVKTLADLKGKVVLIDFWSTKCVPCVQSFPEVAELQKHFEGKDVVILGVTSLFGYFVDTPNHRTVQCRNNPEKELGCFPAYMKGMNINWTIAVSEEDVMNTDFGVLAIPHITIIDRDGKVRYNAINVDNEEKIKLIEELL